MGMEAVDRLFRSTQFNTQIEALCRGEAEPNVISYIERKLDSIIQTTLEDLKNRGIAKPMQALFQALTTLGEGLVTPLQSLLRIRFGESMGLIGIWAESSSAEEKARVREELKKRGLAR